MIAALLLKGRVKGIRFDTLERISEYLRCQTGDMLAFVEHGERLEIAPKVVEPA